MKTYEFNLTIEELEKRTHKDYLSTKKFLKVDSLEYINLDDGDKISLKHLCKAAQIIDKINLQLDSCHNLEVKQFIENEIKQNNKQAILTKTLFDAQKGVCGIDTMYNRINLIKGIEQKLGKGVYPEDLSKEEFHKILIEMLKNKKIEKVKNILTQRNVVIRDCKELVGIDYIDYFKEDFSKVAKELELALQTSTNKDFNEYLKLQAQALKKADPMLDAYADKKWATLQDTPLEFTITRENYKDEMTGTIVENQELSNMLKEHNISPIPKDFLGARVGIINKEGTKTLTEIKKYLPILAKNMPFNYEYTQIDFSKSDDDKQTMVDVDMVMAGGDVGEYRGGITLAENLPNSDKLTFSIGGGRRNVYHRQIRFISDKEKLQKILDETLDINQHKYYLDEADHWFTIGHENVHSLGPREGFEKLGKYANIIEENKADMGALSFIDLLTELGMYSQEQRLQIIVTFITDNFLKSKPILSQAHSVRTVMQNYYFAKHGGYEIINDKIHVNIDKVVPIAKQMLAEIIRVQISADFSKAEEYVNKYFVWTDNMELIAKKLQKISKTLNGKLETELADYLLK